MIRARFACVALGILLARVQPPAQILHKAWDSFGSEVDGVRTFYAVTTYGSVEETVEKVRAGDKAFRHRVEVVPEGDTRRAELDNMKFKAYDPDQLYWYGFSLYLPSSQFPDNMSQYMGQLRFSNIKKNGYDVNNCMMWKECGVHIHTWEHKYGGSGHHLTVNNGRWELTIRYQEPGCAWCEALDEAVFDLGPVVKDVWLDFVYFADWSASSDGRLQVWIQTDGDGYRRVLDYEGPNWLHEYAEGSNSYYTSPFDHRVCAPDYTVGLYWNSDKKARYCYSDHITFYREEAGVDGFSRVSVGGVARPEHIPCDDGDPTTVNDHKTCAECACLGVACEGVPCDDGDPQTRFDAYDADCVCRGQPVCGPVDFTTTAFTGGQAGHFRVGVTLTPYGAGFADAVFGLSHQGSVDAWNDMACLVRFNASIIEARNGDTYMADTPVAYRLDTPCALILDVDSERKQYDVQVAVGDSSAVSIADNYAFRSDWNGCGALDSYAIKTAGGCLKLEGFTIGGGSTAAAAAPRESSGRGRYTRTSTKVEAFDACGRLLAQYVTGDGVSAYARQSRSERRLVIMRMNGTITKAVVMP